MAKHKTSKRPPAPAKGRYVKVQEQPATWLFVKSNRDDNLVIADFKNATNFIIKNGQTLRNHYKMTLDDDG